MPQQLLWSSLRLVQFQRRIKVPCFCYYIQLASWGLAGNPGGGPGSRGSKTIWRSPEAWGQMWVNVDIWSELHCNSDPRGFQSAWVNKPYLLYIIKNYRKCRQQPRYYSLKPCLGSKKVGWQNKGLELNKTDQMSPCRTQYKEPLNFFKLMKIV